MNKNGSDFSFFQNKTANLMLTWESRDCEGTVLGEYIEFNQPWEIGVNQS